MNVNGWNLLYFEFFRAIANRLVDEVLVLREKDPEGYKSHPKTKLLAAVRRAVFSDVPENPDHKKYRMGKKLGPNHRSWRRVKKGGLPPRYRLFFRFDSRRQAIIYAWMNDEHSLRKEGGQKDVYAVFARLLTNGKIPSSFDQLIAQSAAIAPTS